MNNKQLTLGSLFDGIGGFPLAAVLSGVTPLWAAEIEPFCIAVAKERFPDMQHLGKTLFLIMESLIQTKPFDDPVYAFMDKKRAEGKPYYVYMTAGANKFLRIYYGKVKEYLGSLPASE